ncbi:unnamed protein product, partial [marine sediment metagenome]
NIFYYIFKIYKMCICLKWLATANEVRTRIIGLDENIFIPELIIS